MTVNIVEFSELREKSVPFVMKDTFELRPERKYVLIQKACFWVLRKIGAHSIGERVEYTRHMIDADSLLQKIFAMDKSICRQFNREPTRLLIGSKDLSDLLMSKEIYQNFSLRAEYMRDRKICGLTIEVIPWMRGILVMP